MKLLGGHHVSFCVTDLERARRFYGDVLGLAEIPRPDLGLPGAWYRVGDTELHLIVAPAGADTGTPPQRLSPLADHAAFAIPDYDEAVAHLHAAGVPVFGTRSELGQLWVQDPDGHVLELIVPRRR
jgi:glyoxylase I family protein